MTLIAIKQKDAGVDGQTMRYAVECPLCEKEITEDDDANVLTVREGTSVPVHIVHSRCDGLFPDRHKYLWRKFVGFSLTTS